MTLLRVESLNTSYKLSQSVLLYEERDSVAHLGSSLQGCQKYAWLSWSRTIRVIYAIQCKIAHLLCGRAGSTLHLCRRPSLPYVSFT